jgi:hypothetical protein
MVLIVGCSDEENIAKNAEEPDTKPVALDLSAWFMRPRVTDKGISRPQEPW